MKGIVFQMLEHAVSTVYGEAVWDEMLDALRLHGAYASVGNYPDGELMTLLEAVARRRREPVDDTVRWFARQATPLLIERFPEFFVEHRSLRTFLPTLDSIVHPEVRKLYPGAIAPRFRFFESPDGEVMLEYTSPRKLCSFAEGLILGTAAHFGERAHVRQPQCMRRGDPVCTLAIRIDP